jgi:hypothetical protein
LNLRVAISSRAEPIHGAEAAELKIVDVKAYVFLEYAGKLPDDLFVGCKRTDTQVDMPLTGTEQGDVAEEMTDHKNGAA